MFGGADLGSVYANVDLKTGKLATGIAKSKAMMSGLDRSMVASTSKMKGAEKGLAGVGAKLSNLGAAGGRAMGPLAKVGASIGALGKIEIAAAGLVAFAAGLAMCVKAAMKAQAVMAETKAIIKTTGGAAHISASAIEKLSTAIMMKTGYDDEQVQSAANMLLTFPKVRNEIGKGNDIFNKALDLSADMARKFGTDIPQAAKLLGKALGEPVKGVTALRRMGVMLTDQQTEQVKTFVATGDILSAQKVILREVATEVGGVAEAYGTTLSGQIDIAKGAFQNLMETIGLAAIPGLTTAVKDLISTMKVLSAIKVPEWLGQWASNILSIKQGLVTGLKTIPGVGPILKLGESIWGLGKRILGFPKMPKITADIDTSKAVQNISELTGGYEHWKTLAAGKKKIDVETKDAQKNLEDLDQDVAQLDQDLKDLTANITGMGKKLADELAMKGLTGITKDTMKSMLAGMQDLSPAIRKGASDMMKDIIDALAAANPVIKDNASAIMDNISLAIAQVDAKDRTAKVMSDIITTIVTAYSAMDSATAGLIDKLVTGMKSLDPEVRKEAGGITGQIVQGLAAGHPLIEQHMDEIGKAIQDGINKVPADKMTDLKMVEIIGSVIAAYGPLDASTTELLANLQKLAAGMPINPQIGDAQGDPKPSVEKKHADIQTWLDGNLLHPKLGETRGLSPETLAVTIWGRIQAGLDNNPVNPVVGPAKTKISPTIQWPTNEAAGAYMAGKIMAGMQGYFDTNLASPGIGAGGGGAGVMENELNKLSAAWNELNKTAIYGWSQATEIALGRFGQMEEGIASLGSDMTSQILAWRNMRGALDEANISLKNYDDQIAASEKSIAGLEKQQTIYNAALEVSRAELQKLSTMKIAGEGAVSDKSFALEQQSRQLQLAIMQAEDAKNYELASQLTLQKEVVNRQKEEADLQAGITYDPQKRELEKLLDPLGQQEMSFDAIKARIIELTLNTIPSQQKAYDDITARIDAQRLELEAIITAHDEAAVKVAFYSEQVELMAKNFLTRYDEMIAAAQKLNEEMEKAAKEAGAGAGGPANYQTGGPVGPGGGTVEYGEFVLSKPMLKAMGSPRMSPVNVNYSGGDTIVHSHTYLNGREIAHDVSREIGRNASAYSRSGGRY
jgi:hypothetical protein